MTDTPDKKHYTTNQQVPVPNKTTNDPIHMELNSNDAAIPKQWHEMEFHNAGQNLQHEEPMNDEITAHRTTDVYDLAPKGYFTLSKEGRILRLNLNGADMLHEDRLTLIDRNFNVFVTDNSKPIFHDFIERILHYNDLQSCEIELSVPENQSLYVYLTGKKEKNEDHCLITVIDITERKLNEEYLKQEREIFLDIVNTQPAGVYRIRVYRPDKWWKDAWNSSENPPYKMEMASDRFCEIIGKTREEFEDNPAIIVDLIHQEDKADFVSKNEIANNTQIPFHWEGRLIVHGQTNWVHLESIPRQLANGDILWTGLLYDITSQKQKESELAESENKYRELVDHSPDAISIYSDGKIVFINNECLSLMGASQPEELLGKPVIDFVHPDYREYAIKRMKEALNGEKALSLEEEKFIRLDGTILDVEVKSMPILFQQKKSVQLIVRDITERKRAEWLLIQSENRFQQLFNKAPLGYQSLDHDGNLIDVNQQWLDMLGYTREEVIGKNFESFISVEYRSGIQQCLSIIENEGKIHKELEVFHKNGTKLFIALDGRIGYDLQGNFKQTHCILQDITLRRITENELKESRKEFEELFEFAPIGYHEIDSEGRIVRINKTELNMLGYSLKELKGQFVWKISNNEEESRKAALEKLEGMNISLKSFSREFRRKDGTVFPVLIQDKAIRNNEGKITGIRSTIQDITEQLESEKELTKSREDFKTLFEYAPVGYHELDAQGRFVRMNQTELAMLGYSPEELMGEYIWKINADEALSFKSTTEKLQGRKVSTKPYEREIIRKDKSTITVLQQDKILKAKDGTITGIRSSVQDITERKAAELNLQVSESKFRNIFENSIVGKSMTTLDGGLNVNKAFCQIVGYTQDELSHMHWADFTYADDLEYNLKEVSQLLNGEKTFSHWEKRYIHKDGHPVWVDISIFLLRDIHGNPAHFITEIFDITDRKKAEKDLKLSEDKFKKAFMTSPDSVVINRMQDDMYVSINEGFTRIMGYTEKDVLGKTSYDISIWENQSDREKLVRELKEKGYVENQVSQFRNKAGETVYGMMSATLIEIDGNTHILNITRDITELRNTEIALRQSEERFKVLFEDAPDSMFLADPETGIIVDANAAACRLFKRQKQELVGVNQSELHPVKHTGVSVSGFRQHITQSQTLGTTIPVENTILCSDGAIIPVEIMAHSIIVDDKTYILGTFRDISERKKAEQSLRESEEMYRQLVLRIPDGVYKSTPGGKFLDVNPAMVRMLGYQSREELLSIDIKKQLYFETSDRDYVVLNNQNEELSIFPLKKKDGSEIWIEDHGWYNSDKEGNIVTHEGVLRDITERKLAQDALKESEIMLKKTLIESSGLIDNSSEEIDFDKISRTILEISGAKYVGLNIFEENGMDFTTVSISGVKENFLKASKILGFEIKNRKWKYDPTLAAKTKDNTITRFQSLKELSSFAIPQKVSLLIEKLFQLGDAYVVKITKNNKVIGDFTLIFTQGETLKNNELVLLYANQVALFIDRERTGRELRANEEKYRYLFANNPQPMWIYDLETLGFIEVNQAAINHYGYTREEFLSMKITEIRPQEDIPALLLDVSEKWDKRLSAGEWRHIKKNGEIIIVDISSVAVVLNGRNARHVMVQDITERKQAENSLKESEDKYRTMIENSNDLIWTLDREGRVTFANGIALKTTGLKLEEWIGKSYQPLIPEEDMPMILDVITRTMNGESCSYELRFKKSKDQILTFFVNTSPVYIAGKVEGIVSFGQDITESKKSLALLQQSEEKFRSIAEQTSDLISIADESGIIVYASNASKSIFGYEPDEMCNRNFIDFVDESSVEKANETFMEIKKSKNSFTNQEFKLIRKDGTTFYGEMNGSVFNYGDIFGSLVVIRDMTERKKAQEEIEEKMNELVRFHNLTVDREMTMIELKKEINELLKKAGEGKKYTIVD